MLFLILFSLGDLHAVFGWRCPPGMQNVYKRENESADLAFLANISSNGELVTYQIRFYTGANLLTVNYFNNKVVGSVSVNGCTLMSDAGSGNLVIRIGSLQSHDAGVYRLERISSGISTVVTCITLFLLDKPHKAAVSHDNNNVIGRNSQLSCNSVSTTYPKNHTLIMTYSWKVDDVSNPSNARYTYGALNKTLTIMPVSKDDANKTFKCSATESGGDVTGFTSDFSEELLFTVIHGPDPSTTKLAPTNTEYTLNEGVRLNDIRCTGDCYPRCNFKWTKQGTNGASIVSNNAVLSLGTLSRTEAGTFTCEVTNANATVRTEKKQVVVHVNYGPDDSTTKLTPSSTTYTRNDGDSLNDIQCSGNCYPSCNYKWTKSGSNTAVNRATLSLGSLDRTEAGTYTCTVINPTTGSKQTEAVSIFVRYGPGKCNINVQSPYALAEGNTSTEISCQSDCYPSCSYKWINSSTGKVVGSEGIFQLDKVTRYEAGDYTCICENTAIINSSKATTLQVIVNSASLFIEGHKDQKDVTVDEYDTDIQFKCEIDSYKESRVQILFKDVLLKEAHQPTVLTFTRSSIMCSHAGVYTCKGSNQYAQAPSSNINLFVRCSPRPLQQIKQNKTSSLYVPATLTFTTIAYPEPGSTGFLWHKESGVLWVPLLSNNDLLVLSSGLQSNLTILNVSQSDYGHYKVTATNDIGSYVQYLFLVREDTQKQIYTTESREVESNKTGTIVGICFGVLSAGLTVYASYVTVLYKRRSIRKGKRTTEDLNTQVTYINIAEEGTVGHINESSGNKDDSVKLYTELAQYSRDDKSAYDVIQKN